MTEPVRPLEALIAEAVDSLFVNGSGQIADRLVLTVDSVPKRDLGGWCRQAIVDRLTALLQAAALPAPTAELEFQRARAEKWVEIAAQRAIEIEQLQEQVAAAAPPAPTAEPATLTTGQMNNLSMRLIGIRDTLTTIPVPIIQRNIDAVIDEVRAMCAAPPAPPMRQKPMTDDWLFTDEFGQTWRLRRTGDEGMPLLIELESK